MFFHRFVFLYLNKILTFIFMPCINLHHVEVVCLRGEGLFISRNLLIKDQDLQE